MSFVKSHFTKIAEQVTPGQNFDGNLRQNAALSAAQFGTAVRSSYLFCNTTSYAYGTIFAINGYTPMGGMNNTSPQIYLKLFSGSIGTTAAVDAITDFPTNAFSGQALVGGTSVSQSYASPQLTVNFSGSNVAVNSGTATWFIIQFGWPGGEGNAAAGGFPCLWGTVGLQGSGADLIVTETNIVAGTSYQLPKVVVPVYQTVFNY